MPPPSPIRDIRERLINGPLKEGSFIRNVLTVIAGTAVSQAIAVATIPILARIYSPENFGALAKYIAFSTILAVFAALGYQAAIVLPKRHEAALTMLMTCLCISLSLCTLTGLTIVLFDQEIAALMNSSSIPIWLWLVPLGMMARSWFNIFQMWCARNKNFIFEAKGQVTKRLVGEGSKLGLGVLKNFDIGLMLGTLVGTLSGVAYMATKSFREIPKHFWKKVSFRNVRVLLHRYQRFPKFDLFAAFIANLSRNLPVIMLGYFFTSAVVGYFFLAQRMLAAPVQLGGTSVTGVFFQRANEALKAGNLDDISLSVFERLMVIFFTPFSLLCIAAPEITLFFLGAEWEESGIYLRWLALWLFFSSVTSPMNRIFAILERQNELALINVATFTMSVITLGWGGLQEDPILAITLFSCGVSLVWIGQGMHTLRICGVPALSYFRVFFREALKTAPFVIVMAGTRYLTDNLLLIIATFFICLGIFGVLRVRFILNKGR